MSYFVGQQVKLRVTVRDTETGAVVDPGAFTFWIRTTSSYSQEPHEHHYDGVSWSSGGEICSPRKVSSGVFELAISCPADNAYAGIWLVAWGSAPNASGAGAGSGETTIEFVKLRTLSA